jgi:hypothetical protein
MTGCHSPSENIIPSTFSPSATIFASKDACSGPIYSLPRDSTRSYFTHGGLGPSVAFSGSKHRGLGPSVTVSETICICTGPIYIFRDHIHGGPICRDGQDYMQSAGPILGHCKPTRSHILGPSVDLFPEHTYKLGPPICKHTCGLGPSVKICANPPGPFSPSTMQAHPVTHFGPTHLYGPQPNRQCRCGSWDQSSAPAARGADAPATPVRRTDSIASYLPYRIS